MTPQRWAHSMLANCSIVGVIEIIAKPEFSRAGFAGHLSGESKNFGIAVIPDDSCVMLRYIWLIDRNK